jgi:hypothetical protein
MVEVLPSPWASQFEALTQGSRCTLTLCSPYIGREPCERIVCILKLLATPPAVHLLTDLSTDNLLSGATDATAILHLVDSLPSVAVRYLPRLHAKVYIRDDTEAVITSGNMTASGLMRNHELGIRVIDQIVVAQVRAHVTHLAELGAVVSRANLCTLSEAADDLRQSWRVTQASARNEVRQAFEKRVNEVNDTLIGLRVTGRSLDAILSDTLLFLLRGGPMVTVDIHREIQRLHPDLCDDTVDRVINGQRFGKKWKHAVRRAQYHLKQKGKIKLAQGRWSLIS